MEHIQTSVISLSLYETENHIQMHLLMFFSFPISYSVFQTQMSAKE